MLDKIRNLPRSSSQRSNNRQQSLSPNLPMLAISTAQALREGDDSRNPFVNDEIDIEHPQSAAPGQKRKAIGLEDVVGGTKKSKAKIKALEATKWANFDLIDSFVDIQTFHQIVAV